MLVKTAKIKTADACSWMDALVNKGVDVDGEGDEFRIVRPLRTGGGLLDSELDRVGARQCCPQLF